MTAEKVQCRLGRSEEVKPELGALHAFMNPAHKLLSGSSRPQDKTRFRPRKQLQVLERTDPKGTNRVQVGALTCFPGAGDRAWPR